MTREEAKREIDDIDFYLQHHTDDYGERSHDAMMMAIQALSQEPTIYPPCEDCHKKMDEIRRAYDRLSEQEHITTTNNDEPITIIYPTIVCDDAVSRQAILDGIEELKKSPWATDKRGNGFEYLITEALDVVKDLCAKQLPSVTQKSGKWIMSDDGLYRPICDKCGAHPWKGYIPSVEEATEVFKFCPNCGAKMVEPQEGEEQTKGE